MARITKKETVRIVRKIRKELRKPRTNWKVVEDLVDDSYIVDTAFVELLLVHDKKGMLNDYLLSPAYYKRGRGNW